MTHDRFSELLERRHQELLSGNGSHLPDDAETDLQQPLAAAEQCLRLIERVKQADAMSPSLWRRVTQSLDREASQAQSAAKAADYREPENHWIGRFKTLRRLGQGGQATVYLAWDSVARREIALKIPRPDAFFSMESRQRFVREGVASARLSHSHIVTVFEVGQAGPVLYIVSAYSQGRSMATWLAEHGKAPVEIAVRWTRQVADAVEHAHANGIWHRDLKPANVLLEPREAEPNCQATGENWGDLDCLTPKLTDFGLAKLREDGDLRTRTGALLGTPVYMAPEQADGRLGAVGPATDIYGLGMILYELLSGKPPFAGASDAEVLRQVTAEEPTSPRIHRPEMSRDLEAIILTCLGKSPERRYRSARALDDDLARYAQGKPTLVRPLGLAPRAWRWTRRHPAPSLALTFAACLLLAAVAVVTWHRMKVGAAETVASNLRQTSQGFAQQLATVRYAQDVRLAYQAWQTRDALQVAAILSRQIPAPGTPDLRGLFWWRLWGLIHGNSRSIGVPQQSALTLAFSPNGSLLAIGGANGMLGLWDVESNKLKGELPVRSTDVNSVAFSPDGSRLASVGDDGAICIWHVGSQKLTATAQAGAPLNCVTFLNDGKQVACGDHNGQITIWGLEGDLRRQWIAHEGEVNQIALNTHSGRLASAGSDGTVKIWSWETLDVKSLLGHEGSVTALAYSVDGRHLASAGVDHTVRLWQAENGESICALAGHTKRIDTLAFTTTGALASAGADGTLRLWDIHERKISTTCIADPSRVFGVHASPVAPVVATAGTTGVRCWSIDAADRDPCLRLRVAGTESGDFAFSPQCTTLAVAAPDGSLQLCDLSSGRLDAISTADPIVIHTVGFSSEGSIVWKINDAGIARGYDCSSKTLVASLGESSERSHAQGCIGCGGRRLVVARGHVSRQIEIFDLTRLSEKPRRVELPARPLQICLLPDEQELLVILDDPLPDQEWMVGIDTQSGAQSRQPPTNGVKPCAPSYSPDGAWFAYSGGAQQVWLRRRDESSSPPLVLHSPQQCAELVFMPHEPFLIGVGEAGGIFAWSITDGEQFVELDLPSAFYRHVRASGDGQHLAIGKEVGMQLEIAILSPGMSFFAGSAFQPGER